MPVDPRKANAAAANRPRATQELIRRRLQQIYNFLRDGQRTADIYRLCAIARDRERQARAAATIENKTPPLEVWGDDELPKTRQLDEYIRKAKKLIVEDGEQLSREGAFVLGAQYARILDVYSRALADKKYHAALRAIEQISRLFGLEGAIKVQLLPPSEAQSTSGETQTKRTSEMTPESAFLALNEIMSNALARAKAAGQLQGVSAEQLMLGTPVRIVEPSTNGATDEQL